MRSLNRLVALLLAAALVAVPIFRPAPAVADQYGETAARVIIDDYSVRGGWGFGCDLVGYWATAGDGYNQLRVSGQCKTGQFADDTWLRLIVDDDGPCAATSTEVGNIDEVAQQEIGPGATLLDGNGCGPATEICWQTKRQRFLAPDTDWSTTSCENWDVGTPPAASPSAGDADGCAYLASPPSAPTYEAWMSTGTTRSWRIIGSVNITTTGAQVLSVQGVWKHETTGEYRAGNRPEGSTATGVGVTGATGTQTVTTLEQKSSWYTSTDLHPWKLVGVSLFLSGPALPTRTVTLTGNTLGITNGATCQWYWGEDFRTDTPVSPYVPPGGSGNLDPPVGTPPDGSPEPPTYTDPDAPTEPDDGTCEGFSLTDPSSWAGPAMCMLVKVLASAVGLLGDLLSAIVGLVADLLGGLFDLFMLLFVPDGDAWTGLIDGLAGTWDEGAGGEWMSAFSPPGGGEQMRTAAVSTFSSEPTTSAATSSCEGPEIDLGGLGLPEQFAPEPMKPFKACEGTAATVAENVRKWTGVGLVLGAGFKIFEMIIGGFGAMRQVRIMSGHDWTGPGSGRF